MPPAFSVEVMNPEDGVSRFLRNFSTYLSDYRLNRFTKSSYLIRSSEMGLTYQNQEQPYDFLVINSRAMSRIPSTNVLWVMDPESLK
jgi:hypothetical protein